MELNIKDEIIREHSKENTLRLCEYIGDDADKFDELMELFFSPEYRMNQRASWIVGYCADRNPGLFRPYLERMVSNLDNPVHDAVVRNTLRIFQDLEIPEPLMGELADKCFNYLQDPNFPIAIRVFSMSVIHNISMVWPELMNELKMIIEEHLPFGSAGFKSRGKTILRKIDKYQRSHGTQA